MRKLVVIDIAGLSPRMVGGSAQTLASLGDVAPLESPFPAVTSTVQATFTTGRDASGHGIVANGFYFKDLGRTSFWEQADSLVTAPKVWETAAGRDRSFKSAMLFWQNSIGSANDVVLTPAPIHEPDGRIVSSCYSKPGGLYDELARELGEFPLARYWGPMASFESTDWIARATARVIESFAPNLTLTYLPALDYSLQRFGYPSEPVETDLALLDRAVALISQAARSIGADVMALSEYGIENVSGDVPVNRFLREAGLLAIRLVGGGEYLDFAASRAFAVVDHQVAHVYARADSVERAAEVLRNAEGVERVLAGSQRRSLGIDHPRAGDVVAVAAQGRWFSYPWWSEAVRAPAFARAVDIHAKPGYDPLELFIDPAKRSIASDPALVKGSHGRPASAMTGVHIWRNGKAPGATGVAGEILDFIFS